ncbi:MAG: hypothetical protein KBS42_05435, partial [Bacteroidales bacterium]|nr:hypothetical protein [Candidatus Colicola coprequi]
MRNKNGEFLGLFGGIAVAVVVVDTDEAAGKSKNFPERDKNGMVNDSGRVNDQTCDEQSTAEETHEECCDELYEFF